MRTGQATWGDTEQVSTLDEARAVLSWLAPPPGAPADAWRSYHRRAAKVYRRVAKVDRMHHYETLAYAQIESDHVERIDRDPDLGCKCYDPGRDREAPP